MASSGNDSFKENMMLIASILVWILAGVWAWDWTEPESFGGALLFLLAWSVFGYIGQIVLGILLIKLFGES